MMRNKSRKRILHEQRVEIARLKRDKAFLEDKVRRMAFERLPPKIISYSLFIRDRDNAEIRDMVFENYGNRIIRDIVRTIVRSNVMQIVSVPVPEFGATKLTFTLKFVPVTQTDIDPCEAFKNVGYIDFCEP